MKKWEYKVENLGGTTTIIETQEEPLLNSFGAEGWELVAVTSPGTSSITAYLKREKA